MARRAAQADPGGEAHRRKMNDAEADRTRQHLPEPTMPWQAPGAHIVDVGGSPGDRVGGAVSVRTLVDLKRGNERKESCDVFLDRRRGHGLRPGIKLVRPHEVVRAAGVMRLLCVLSAFSVFRALSTMISSRVLPFLLPPFFPRAAFYRPARPTIFAPHAVASNAPGVCARLRDCIHRARREKTSSDVAACLTVRPR